MIPILPINKPNPQAYKADLSVATPSPDSATGAMAFDASFGYSDLAISPARSLSSSTSSSSMPPPPPPSPTNDMLDITPRKCSFSSLASSSTARTNNTCAFPSWPNRPSLLNTNTSPDCLPARERESSTASAFLSDEDLYVPDAPDTPPAVDEESAARAPAAPVLTTEQQVQLLKAAAEEERCRARVMAQVKAHQALRLTHDPGFRPKRKSRSDKRRPRLGSNLGYRG